MAQHDPTRRFYDLVWPHMATVLRTAQFLTRNAAEAEDLAQETLMKAFRFIDRFQEGTDVRGWLMAILRNTRIDRLRATGRALADVSLDQVEVEPPDRPAAPLRDPADLWDNPEEILNGFSDQNLIDALHELPEEIRWTLLLVDVEQLDHQQAAEILQVPVGTIKSRAHRGRAMIRDYLQASTAAQPRDGAPGGRL